MRLIDRYLIREWLFPFVYCLVGFMVLWIAFDLIAELDEFAEAKLSAAAYPPALAKASRGGVPSGPCCSPAWPSGGWPGTISPAFALG